MLILPFLSIHSLESLNLRIWLLQAFINLTTLLNSYWKDFILQRQIKDIYAYFNY